MITVVIPSHNRVAELKRALHSVYVQSEKPSEIIVVDDGSSPQVENSIFVDCPEEITTKLLRNEVPRGANHARNRGIKAASGEWIAFLDDDDEFFVTKIKVIIDEINRSTDVIDIIYHPAKIHMVNEGISYITSLKKFNSDDDIVAKLLIKNEIGGTPMVVAKKQTLIDAGLFDENLPALQDREMWLRLAINGAKFMCVDTPLTHYNLVTSVNSLSKDFKANKSGLKHIYNKHKSYYESLSEEGKLKVEENSLIGKIKRAILNKNKLTAAKFSLLGIVKYKHPKFLIYFISSLLSIRFIYLIRKKIWGFYG